MDNNQCAASADNFKNILMASIQYANDFSIRCQVKASTNDIPWLISVLHNRSIDPIYWPHWKSISNSMVMADREYLRGWHYYDHIASLACKRLVVIDNLKAVDIVMGNLLPDCCIISLRPAFKNRKRINLVFDTIANINEPEEKRLCYTWMLKHLVPSYCSPDYFAELADLAVVNRQCEPICRLLLWYMENILKLSHPEKDIEEIKDGEASLIELQNETTSKDIRECSERLLKKTQALTKSNL